MSWLTGDWNPKPFCRVVDDSKSEGGWLTHYEKSGLPAMAYRVIGLAEDDSPATISRVCGEDESGTLYIGQARQGSFRIGSVVTTYHPDYSGGSHPGLSAKLAERFPPQKLAVVWECVTGDPKAREKELIEAYVAEFGEAPPLNSISKMK